VFCLEVKETALKKERKKRVFRPKKNLAELEEEIRGGMPRFSLYKLSGLLP
jgi:hypothetical protein